MPFLMAIITIFEDFYAKSLSFLKLPGITKESDFIIKIKKRIYRKM